MFNYTKEIKPNNIGKEIVFLSFKYYCASRDCRVVIQETTKIKKERKR